MRRGFRISRYVAMCIFSIAGFNASAAIAAPVWSGKGMELFMLGTGGGPILRKNRAEPSQLLVVDGRPYLIDCGIGTIRRMLELGIDPALPHTVFITHHHPDHDMELASFMGNAVMSIRWNNRDGSAYNLYGPAGTAEMVAAAIRYISVPMDTFAAEGMTGKDNDDSFLAHDIVHPGLIYQDDKIKVTAIENSHYSLMPASSAAVMKSYSYRFDTPYGSIVFTGDTGPSVDLEKFTDGADVLVSEVINEDVTVAQLDQAAKANKWPEEKRRIAIEHMEMEHSAPAVVARLAASSHVKAVILSHIVPGLDNDEQQIQSDVEGVKAGYDGQVIAARDLDHFCIKNDAESAIVAHCP